jgi:hypothetical protein
MVLSSRSVVTDEEGNIWQLLMPNNELYNISDSIDAEIMNRVIKYIKDNPDKNDNNMEVIEE